MSREDSRLTVFNQKFWENISTENSRTHWDKMYGYGTLRRSVCHPLGRETHKEEISMFSINSRNILAKKSLYRLQPQMKPGRQIQMSKFENIIVRRTEHGITSVTSQYHTENKYADSLHWKYVSWSSYFFYKYRDTTPHVANRKLTKLAKKDDIIEIGGTLKTLNQSCFNTYRNYR